MLGKRNTILVAALFAAAVLLTGRFRLLLDDIAAPFRDDFRTMMYLPRGDALKVAVAGFDAPAADALFIKALVYYPRVAKQTRFKDESKLYVYELFDAVTDLSPRFYRAYQTGALFLTASESLEANRQGLRLLRKGVGVYDRLEAAGTPAPARMDPRWLFHSLTATTLEVNVQSRLRAAGDVEGAAAARLEAAGHFRLAAASPNAPPYIIAAARGFESVLKGRGDIAAARAAVLSVWRETYNQAVERGEEKLAADLKIRVDAARRELAAIILTRRLQSVFTRAGELYRRSRGRLPESADELRKAGLLSGVPGALPLDALAERKDEMLVLPGGAFRSRVLAQWETREHLDLLMDGVILYRRFNGPPPPDLETLVTDGILAGLPEPPLAALGQEYEYNAASGVPGTSRRELFE